MKLIFNINYRANWGESVYITGNTDALGNNDLSKAVKLNIVGDDFWWIAIDFPEDTCNLRYHYVILNEDGFVKSEWGHGNVLRIEAGVSEVAVYDRWQSQPYDKPFYSSAITDCICARDKDDAPVVSETGMVTLSVAAPVVDKSCVLAVTGSCESLGAWLPEKALRMSDSDFPVWKVNIPASDINADTEFKFIIIRKDDGSLVEWGGGENRRIGYQVDPNTSTVIAGMRFIGSGGLWKCAGTAIPVFSLRSDDDMGVGDFYDIFKLIDWAVVTGQRFIQLLPINDTTMTHTWTDSYPYNANSTFALHPMYLRVDAVGELKNKARKEHYRAIAKELNALDTVDYERANEAKLAYVREIFTQDGKKTLSGKEFKDYYSKNEYWLRPYAAFCALRDKFGTPDFTQWGKYARFSAKVLDEAVKEFADDVNLAYFIQYHLDRQMRLVHDYANSKGVALKGDIPIGISRTSADAWVDTRLFNMDCQAGAPPDDFSVLGQNWGFPTYNWEEMNKDGFAWWKARFRKMSEYFHAYRIDHVLGFFRIWQIPMDALHGLLGYFNPALPYSIDELRYKYDFWIDAERHTKPFIMDYFLNDFFGPYTDDAKKFMKKQGDRYQLKEEYNTQRKIADYFAALPKDEKNSRLCDGLIGLIDNVLFIEDPAEKGKYHPRIAAQFTFVYRSLNDYERWCFDRLYNDFFYHRHNDFWYGKAMHKLPPLIDSTDMLVCAEDLGMIPACVPAVLQQLEILSLEIQRMPKDPGQAFGDTWNYPYYSVCTTSTHDMGGIRQWWEERPGVSQRFFNEVLHEWGAAPAKAEPWICERIVNLNLQSPSMLCILPLQDWMSVDGKLRRANAEEEQINVPANSRHYWRYRMHLTLEDLLARKEFNATVTTMVKNSGR